jgi:hypothetical protein
MAAEGSGGGDVVDLEGLRNFSFRPNWERTDGTKYAERSHRGWNDGHDDGRGWQKRGERPGGKFSRDGKSGDRGHFRRDFRSRDGDFPQRRGDFRGKDNLRPPFEPIVDVEFYPTDAVFEAMVATLKATYKTYELFAVTRLFLEKPERFAMVIKKTETQSDNDLYLAVDDGFAFETEGEAVAHVLGTHRDKYFAVEEREGQPPAGSFPCLHRCGITGKDLCPPNYHRYQEILLKHHERFLSRVPFDKVRARIEKITDSGEIEKWRVEAAKTFVFIPKGLEGVELKSEEEAHRYFVENFKDRAIVRQRSIRIPGETFARMPRGNLGRSIFIAIEREKRFPLKFSNNLRGRLRRSGFTIYKVGGKPGITYISGVRRKFRTTGEVFADDIQRIMDRIDAHKRISVASLYLQCMEGGPSGTGVPPTTAAEGGVSDGEAGRADGLADRNHALLKNLHWLIREGYVAEFEDGTLLATEIMPQRTEKPEVVPTPIPVETPKIDENPPEEEVASGEVGEDFTAADEIPPTDAKV